MQNNQQHINQLLQACKEQSQPAQFKIYKLYYKAMYNTALRIMGDSFEAEDIMQESFLSAFTKLDTFKGDVAFGAWLKRIVINKSLTQIKKNNRFEEVKFEVIKNNVNDLNDEIEIDEKFDYSKMKAKEIVSTINLLKDNYRVALTLSLIEGFDNEEVAGIMKISDENCRVVLFRAKSKLKKIIEQQAQIN